MNILVEAVYWGAERLFVLASCQLWYKTKQNAPSCSKWSYRTKMIFGPKMFQGYFWGQYYLPSPTDLVYCHLRSTITMSNINTTMLWFVICFSLYIIIVVTTKKNWCYVARPCIICLDNFWTRTRPKKFPSLQINIEIYLKVDPPIAFEQTFKRWISIKSKTNIICRLQMSAKLCKHFYHILVSFLFPPWGLIIVS